jgi:DNA-binding NarL/FixJ family response regulator
VGSTVLIVDDHPTFRHFARKLLERSGFDVVGEAADCASALEAAAALQPDAILLDVMLPDGSGVDVAATLAARSTTSTVVLTSSRSAADLGAAIRGWNFLPKSDLSGVAFSSLLRFHGVA